MLTGSFPIRVLYVPTTCTQLPATASTATGPPSPILIGRPSAAQHVSTIRASIGCPSDPSVTNPDISSVRPSRLFPPSKTALDA